MPKNKETNNKNYVPGTNPTWGYEVPDGYTNSMVDKKGRVVDTGWNFDEKDGDWGGELTDEERATFESFKNIADDCPFDPEVARELAKQADERNAHHGENEA